MPSVDRRTRFLGDTISLGVDDLFTGPLADALAERGADAAPAARRLGLSPLTLVVDGEAVTLDPNGTQLMARRGERDGAVVASMDQLTFSDLVQDEVSTFGSQMTGRVALPGNEVDRFVEWEPVLRYVFDDRPVYDPGSIDFHDRQGAPLTLPQSSALDDDPAAIAHFLAEAGFVHLEGVFSEAEMDAVSADLDAAIATAEQDDGASWWAKTEAGEWYPSRILGFNQKSPALAALLQSERFLRIGTFTDDTFVHRNGGTGDTAEGLLKKVGVVEGISDVSWHKDCAMGGHSRGCCGLTVGISVTGAGPTNGELGVVAGSHRANVVPLGVDGLDLPRIPLPTRTGDVTVHCSCTLHMSRPPVSAERRVVYTSFSLADRPGDRREVLSPEEIRRARASLNDHTRRQQRDAVASGSRMSNFEL